MIGSRWHFGGRNLVLSVVCLLLAGAGTLSAAAFTAVPGPPSISLTVINLGGTLVSPNIIGSATLIQAGSGLPVILTDGGTPSTPNLVMLGVNGGLTEAISVTFDDTTFSTSLDFLTAFIDGTGLAGGPLTDVALIDLLGLRTYIFGSPTVEDVDFGEGVGILQVVTYTLAGVGDNTSPPPSPVPEPATFVLMGAGLSTVYMWKLRRVA